MQKQPYFLITGASSGIGAACARLLAKEKKSLILLARRTKRLEELKAELEREYGIEVKPFTIDLGDLRAIERFFAEIKDFEIDGLINNAGFVLGKAAIDESDWADFEQMIDINIKAFTRVAQLAVPFLKRTQGHIVNISSIAGYDAYEGGSVYCGTKAYVRMLSQTLREDLHGTGVRVTDIAPGAVDTEFSTVRFKGDKTKADTVYEGFTPLYAHDIAETIVFALSRPKSVNIDQMLVMPTAQVGATRFVKK